jgi:hypothetical protein
MRWILIAVLIGAGLSGCSRGPSCDDLTQQMKIAEIKVMGAQARSDITGLDTELKLALTEQQHLMDEYADKGCSS